MLKRLALRGRRSPSEDSPSYPSGVFGLGGSGDGNDIANLRDQVKKRPRNARLVATLAHALAEESARRGEGDDGGSSEAMREEAVVLAQKSIKMAPRKPFGYVALSIAHDDHDTRMGAIEQAVQWTRTGRQKKKEAGGADVVLARINLLPRLLMEPRWEEARVVRGSVGAASPLHPQNRELDEKEEALYEQIESSLQEFYLREKDSQVLPSQLPPLRDYKLGIFYRKMRPIEKYAPIARKHLHRACRYLPEHDVTRELARFWSETLPSATPGSSDHFDDGTGAGTTATVTKCPQEYVVSLYSTFASRFDELLVEKLDYRTPTELRMLVDSATAAESQGHGSDSSTGEGQFVFERAADLGCGTGLSGLAFRDRVRHLTGVDLSPEMLSKASERRCYDRLLAGDITAALKMADPEREEKKDGAGEPEVGAEADADAGADVGCYDLVFSCDVFVYFGDLEEVFVCVSRSMKFNGVFAFSTELLENDEGDDGEQTRPPNYHLQPCARFAHSQPYVESLAQRTGFAILATRVCPIRKNGGVPVIGLLVVLKKETAPMCSV